MDTTAEPPAGQPTPGFYPDPTGVEDAVRQVFAEALSGAHPDDVFPKQTPDDMAGVYTGLEHGSADELLASLEGTDDDVPPYSSLSVWPDGGKGGFGR